MKINDIFNDSSPWTKLGLTAFIAVSSLLFFIAISFLLTMPLFGLSFKELQSELNVSTSSNINIIKYFQIVQAIALFIIPALIAGRLLFIPNFLSFKKGLSSRFSIQTMILAMFAMVIALPLINILALVNQQLSLPEALRFIEIKMQESENEAKVLTEAFLAVNSTKGLIINIVMIGILPAIGEELLFRGLVQRIFVDITKNIHVAILLTSMLFSALHFQFYGFIPRMLMGVYFGYLLVWTKNLWIPIAAHFANNTFAVLIYYFYFNGKMETNIDEIGTTPNDILAFAISTILTAGIIFIIYSIEKKREKQYETNM